jgi:TRAP-type C4-dicarboxylate transport system permease small subunit
MSSIRLLNRFLLRLETVLLVFFLSVMIVLAFAQVMMRNLFSTGFLWGDPLVRQMVLWAGFMGAAVATSEGRHISIDVITKFLPDRRRYAARVLTSLAGAVISYFLGSAALTFLLDEKEAGGVLIQGIPSWIGLLIIPAGYGLMAIHFLLVAVEQGHQAVHGDGAAGKEET